MSITAVAKLTGLQWVQLKLRDQACVNNGGGTLLRKLHHLRLCLRPVPQRNQAYSHNGGGSQELIINYLHPRYQPPFWWSGLLHNSLVCNSVY